MHVYVRVYAMKRNKIYLSQSKRNIEKEVLKLSEKFLLRKKKITPTEWATVITNNFLRNEFLNNDLISTKSTSKCFKCSKYLCISCYTMYMCDNF